MAGRGAACGRGPAMAPRAALLAACGVRRVAEVPRRALWHAQRRSRRGGGRARQSSAARMQRAAHLQLQALVLLRSGGGGEGGWTNAITQQQQQRQMPGMPSSKPEAGHARQPDKGTKMVLQWWYYNRPCKRRCHRGRPRSGPARRSGAAAQTGGWGRGRGTARARLQGRRWVGCRERGQANACYLNTRRSASMRIPHANMHTGDGMLRRHPPPAPAAPHPPAALTVELAHHRLDGLGGLLQVVVGDLHPGSTARHQRAGEEVLLLLKKAAGTAEHVARLHVHAHAARTRVCAAAKARAQAAGVNTPGGDTPGPPAHLGKEVVHHVGANVVVDLVEDAVVAVNGGQAAAEVRPLLRTGRGGGWGGGGAPTRWDREAPAAQHAWGRQAAALPPLLLLLLVPLPLPAPPLRAWGTAWALQARTSLRYQGTSSSGSLGPWWCR